MMNYMVKIKPVGRKHSGCCKICEKHPLFDLDEKVFIHGHYYTKEYLLDLIRQDINRKV